MVLLLGGDDFDNHGAACKVVVEACGDHDEHDDDLDSFASAGAAGSASGLERMWAVRKVQQRLKSVRPRRSVCA